MSDDTARLGASSIVSVVGVIGKSWYPEQPAPLMWVRLKPRICGSE